MGLSATRFMRIRGVVRSFDSDWHSESLGLLLPADSMYYVKAYL